MWRLLGLVVICVSVLSLPLRAEPITEFSLSNGMQVVVIEDHRAPVVVHMVWYPVGAADEPPGKSGIAHFLEHLMFKGTDTLGPGEFSAAVEAQGGRDNAFTSWDYTGYFQRVAADRLELMMEMEADRMVNLALPPAEVETERAVILEERGQVVESRPGSVFREIQRAAQYLNHPYATPIIGWRHEMEGLTREDALAFYKAHYAPNNAILIVAGDVTPGEVREMAERHYGAIPAREGIGPQPRPQEPPQLVERRFVYPDARVSEPLVSRSYLAPPRRSGAQEEAAALLVLAELLGGSSATSVLGRALEFDEQIALYTAAGYGATSRDTSTFVLTIAPQPGVSLQEAEDAMDAVIEQFLADGVDEGQLERIKTRIRASEIYAMDDAARRARRYGTALTSGLTVEDERVWPEVLQAVTAEDVMDAGRRVLDRRQAVTGWMVQGDSGVTQ
jgi:zinc protease